MPKKLNTYVALEGLYDKFGKPSDGAVKTKIWYLKWLITEITETKSKRRFFKQFRKTIIIENYIKELTNIPNKLQIDF